MYFITIFPYLGYFFSFSIFSFINSNYFYKNADEFFLIKAKGTTNFYYSHYLKLYYKSETCLLIFKSISFSLPSIYVAISFFLDIISTYKLFCD